jgi:hypothetical protein
MTEAGGTPRYRFGPRSTRGLIAGWTGGQIACVAVGTLIGLGLLRSVGGAGGALLGVCAAAAGVAVAAWPVGGRPVEAWVPTVRRHLAAQLADPAAAPWAARERRSPFRHLAIRSASEEDWTATLAVVEDRAARTWTAVLPVGGVGFAVLDEDGQSSAVAAWSGVLAALAADGRAGPRLQWIARTYPARLGGRVRFDAPRDRAGRHSRAVDDYQLLLTEAERVLWEREVLLALTLPIPRGATATAAAQLAQSVETLSERVRAAGLSPGEPLDEAGLVQAMRHAYAKDSVPSAPVSDSAFPLGMRAGWSNLRTDDTWHATYWIAEWPRGEVGPGVLVPLLAGTGARATVSCTMAPLPPMTAVRRAERERTSGAADAELRVRHGFSLTARARREQETRHQREDELAAGHAAYLFAGYVSVSADDEEGLAGACEEIEQQAAVAQLELRRLFGAQCEGWLCTLPLGRGCR